MKGAKTLSVSLPPDLFDEAARVARRERTTKSELMREALRIYLREREWEDVRRRARERAAARGIHSEDDVVGAIHQFRRERRSRAK